MAAEGDASKGCGEQFPRVTNDEYLALAGARPGTLQHGIVPYLI